PRVYLLVHVGYPPRGVLDPLAIGVVADPLEDQPNPGFDLLLVERHPSRLLRYAGTRCSSVSGSASRSGSSAARGSSLVSPSRLVHTAVSPSSLHGARSWNRLAATWTCR